MDREIERVTLWAAIECEKQRSGERSVGWMVSGWRFARASFAQYGAPTADLIQKLGVIVEPRKNKGTWRQVPVFIGYDSKANWRLLPRLMDSLIAEWDTLSADD